MALQHITLRAVSGGNRASCGFRPLDCRCYAPAPGHSAPMLLPLSRELYEPSRRSGALEQRLLEIGDLTVLESNFQVLIYVDHFCARLQDLLGCSKDLVDLLDGLT
jgi:hypothetical protein